MSSLKDDAESSAARWNTAARIKGYRCLVCGEIPPYEERETYFNTKLCDWCRHQSEKDD
jgi:hypothetical protein